MEEKSRFCKFCKINKPLNEWSLTRSGYFRYACKDCARIKAREYKRENPTPSDIKNRYRLTNKNWKNKQKDTHLKRLFGISLDEYTKMLEEQKGLCYLCDRSYTEFKKSHAVDHCHITGKVRKLLCMDCNATLGKLENNLERILRYLNEHK